MKKIEELRSYNKSYYSEQEIANKLIELSGINEDVADIVHDLDFALHNINAMAQNEYNVDSWRTLYNILLAITEDAPRF